MDDTLSTQIWLGVDGSNWVHTLWHAMGGEGVLSAFQQRIQALSDYTKASQVLVMLDRPCFRQDLLPSYKANRKPKDESLKKDLNGAIDVIAPVAVPVYENGYEADDLLATLAKHAVSVKAKCILATSDKDVWQCLVPGQVSVLRKFSTSQGAKQTWQTAASLESDDKTLGLTPDCWRDNQCLVGQPRENIEGCPGWGEKTARVALAAHKTIEGILANLESVECNKSQRAKIQEWAAKDLDLCRKLVTLRTDSTAVLDAMK